MECVTLELKYCERCGALGLRQPHSSESYCESCAQMLTRQLVPLGRRHRSLRHKTDAMRRRSLASPTAPPAPESEVRP